MDAINALDSSMPKPKKKRENKPLPKPPAKPDVQPPLSDGTPNEGTMLGGDVTPTPAKNSTAKKNRSRKTASLNSSDAMNSNIDAIDVTPSLSIPSPFKEPLKEENVNVAAHSEVKSGQKSDKKSKKMNEDTLGENIKESLEQGIDIKEEINIYNNHRNKKDAKGNVDSEEPIGNVEITESLVQHKKLKKKKKNKSEDILEQETESEIISEKTAEEENTVQSKKAKKKKRKEKIDAGSPDNILAAEETQMGEPETEEKTGEENLEPLSNEKKRKKKRKHRERDSELIDENRKVFEEQKDEGNVTNLSECTEKEENHKQTAELNHKSKKTSSIKNNSVVLTPLQPGHDKLGLPLLKKKSE